jgi:ABC-2 type transport system permease protein
MSFDKILIILRREYLTRVRTKAFIISTILAPVFILALIGIPIMLSFLETDRPNRIGVQDETGTLVSRFMDIDSTRYLPLADEPIDTLRAMVLGGRIDGYILLNESHISGNADIEFLSGGKGGLSLMSDIRSDIRTVIRDERLDRANVSAAVKDIMASRPSVVSRKITETGDETTDTLGMFIVGYVMCFIIYGAMFGYGAIIMRSVIEEKTSRIIEIITSSARPFELLMGKVLGVGAVGLTQFSIWAVSSSAIMAGAGLFMARDMSPMSTAGASAAAAEAPFVMPEIGLGLWVAFVFFFLMGYLIYSALFAAVGSAADNETDTQQLMLPITLPIIIPMMLIGPVSSDPNSTLAVVSSLIPFFTPMLMPLRIAMTDVPLWQLGSSVILMAGTFTGLIWLSARIYRVGILMYGKKASFKEMAKWIRYS